MKKAGKIIAYVLIVVLLIGAIGLIFKFTNGGTTDFKTFYVVANNKTYMANGTIALKNGENRFETKYTFESNKPDKHKGYSVKIVPNVTKETDFNFLVDDEQHTFSSETDLTSGFDIRKDTTGFVIVNNGITVENVLQKVYENRTLTINDTFDLEKCYFNIVITSYDEQSVVVLGLILKIPVESVTLDKENILL